jgi:hypothetical protein
LTLPLWRLQPCAAPSLLPPPEPPAGLSPPCCRRPWWPATGGREVWHLVAVGFLLFFFSLANKQAAARSRSVSVFLQIFHSHGHSCREEGWSLVRAESHAGTPWQNRWRGVASAPIAPTPLTPFLFFNKSETAKVSPLYDVDLETGSLLCAARFPAVPQQRTYDGWCRLASALNGRRAALLSHAMALLQSPVWRPQPEILVGVQYLLVPKRFIPGGGTVAGGGVPDPVERTKDWIAFLVFGVGSFLQCLRTPCCVFLCLSGSCM